MEYFVRLWNDIQQYNAVVVPARKQFLQDHWFEYLIVFILIFGLAFYRSRK